MFLANNLFILVFYNVKRAIGRSPTYTFFPEIFACYKIVYQDDAKLFIKIPYGQFSIFT